MEVALCKEVVTHLAEAERLACTNPNLLDFLQRLTLLALTWGKHFMVLLTFSFGQMNVPLCN